MLVQSQRFKRWVRIHWSTLVITGVLLLFVLRIGWLQFIDARRALPHDPHTLMSQSIIQRERGIELDSGRGRIVDTNGIRLTGQTQDALVLFPLHEAAIQSEAVQGLSRILSIQPSELLERWKQAVEPLVWKDETDEKRIYSLGESDITFIRNRHWAGVEILPYTDPYPLMADTPHWIGYTSQLPDQSKHAHIDEVARYRSVGAYGLERSFEPLLKGIGGSTYVQYTDASRMPLQGLGLRVSKQDNPYYPLQLVTTVNMHIQQEASRIMDEQGIRKGAVVVLDTATRDVIAMVSKPAYNPQHIHPQEKDWNNQALQAMAPGSVFKLVIAAAAIETGAVSSKETFYCNGHYGKYGLSCWKQGGHGQLTLAQALAQSCNIVFAQLGERLGSRVIEQYAGKLGLTGTIGMVSDDGMGHDHMQHFDGEQSGRVFIRNEQGQVVTDGGIRAQTAIGQRDVRITPLAAANAMVTLVQGGSTGHPRLVKRVEDRRGNTIVAFPAQSRLEAGIDHHTASLIQKWMRLVVTNGTGASLQDSSWEIAGKSGTAQVKAYGTDKLNSWFVGYAPARQPQYAVAVVSMDESSEGNQQRTIGAFKKVIQLLEMSEKG